MAPSPRLALVALGLLASPAFAQYDMRVIPEEKEGEFTSFRSRPDLRVPIWKIQNYREHDLAPGYWFVSPYENVHPPEADSPPWVAPCIYDTDGELLWSAGDMFANRNTQDFHLSEVLGETMLTMIYQDGGSGVMLDHHFEKRYEVPIGVNLDTLNIHDWNMIENGTRVLNFKKYLVQVGPQKSAAIGYDGGCRVEYQIFYERDAANDWEPVFEWNAFDHIPLDETTYYVNMDPAAKCDRGWYDYFHANSVDKCPDGEYVLSARHTDTIYKIQRDGEIAWRLGGLKNDFEHDFNFSRQHHVRCHAQNETHTIVTFLDNAVGPDPQKRTNDWSRGLMVAIDTQPDVMKATVIGTYDDPSHQLTDGRGSMQVLPNGNILMGWSGGGKHSEYSSDGKLLMEAEFVPGYLRTYRTYKSPFVGRPTHSPDVVSEVVKKQGEHRTNVYVSWNGATEAKIWNLYKSNSEGSATMLLSSTPRSGFETLLSQRGYSSFVIVEGLDADGNVLGRSPVIHTKALQNMPSSLVAAELEWLRSPTADQSQATPTPSDASPTRGAQFLFFLLGFIACASLGFVLWFTRRLGRLSLLRWGGPEYQLVAGSEKTDAGRHTSRHTREGSHSPGSEDNTSGSSYMPVHDLRSRSDSLARV